MVEEMPVLVSVLVRNGWGNACVSGCVSKKGVEEMRVLVCVCVLVRNG